MFEVCFDGLVFDLPDSDHFDLTDFYFADHFFDFDHCFDSDFCSFLYPLRLLQLQELTRMLWLLLSFPDQEVQLPDSRPRLDLRFQKFPGM